MTQEFSTLKMYDSEREAWEGVMPHLENLGFKLDITQTKEFSLLDIQNDKFTCGVAIDLSRGMSLETLKEIITAQGWLYSIRTISDSRTFTFLRFVRGEECYLAGYYLEQPSLDGEAYHTLSKPHLSWLYPVGQRLKSLVQALDDPVNSAASSLPVNHASISNFLINIRSQHAGVLHPLVWIELFTETLDAHFVALEQVITIDDEAKTALRINTYTHDLKGIMEENRAFIKSLMRKLFSRLGIRNMRHLEWSSLTQVLMDLADGRNGVYENDAAHFNTEELLITEVDGKVTLSVSDEYNKARKQDVKKHNQQVQKLTELESSLRPYAADIMLLNSPDFRKQGKCPVQPNHSKHSVHIYQWIVDIAEACYKAYISDLEG
jgi:hypothetical protein